MLPIVIRPVPESKCSLLTGKIFVLNSFMEPLWQNFAEQAYHICSNSHGPCSDSWATLHHAFALPTRNILCSAKAATWTPLTIRLLTDAALLLC